MRLRLTLLFIAAALVVPAVASAASVSVVTGTAEYVAEPGEFNDVLVGQSIAGEYTFTDLRDDMSAGAGCVDEGATVRCIANFADLEMGNFDDDVTVRTTLPVRVFGGDGDDRMVSGLAPGPSQAELNGGTGVDTADYRDATSGVRVTLVGTVDGRAGDRDVIAPGTEEIIGSRHVDVLTGSTGDETFIGGPGADTIAAEGGDDRVIAPQQADGADRIDLGPGRDTMSYANRFAAVNVTLDGGGADGEAGEGDDIRGVEVVEGGFGADTLVGPPGITTASATLVGGPNADTLVGGTGPDKLIGGGGVDKMDGKVGDDEIDSRDGLAEIVICGPGFADVARIDTRPRSATSIIRAFDSTVGCESQPNIIVGTATVDRLGDEVFRVAWTHPRAWRELRRVELRLRDGARVVAKRSFPARGGQGRRLVKRLRVELPDAVADRVLSADVSAVDRRGRRETVRLEAAVR